MASELAILVALLAAIFAIIAAVFKFGSWYGEVNSDRIMFKEFMAEVRRDLNLILTRLPPLPMT